MSSDSYKVRKSLNIKPNASAGTEAGDIRVDSTASNALKFHNGTTEKAIQTSANTLNASTAVVTDSNGDAASSAVTSTELGYVSGVTSAIQTQLNGKQASGNYVTALTGDVTASGPGSAAATIAAGAVDNSKISASAAIARSKIAAGTASQVLINDVSGNLSSEAQLAKSRGGTGADNSSVTFPSSGTIVTEAGTETLTNKTLGSTNTLTGSKIASFTSDGVNTLTAPASTDTLVARATTDTLTNKTISGSNNTITNVSLTSGVTNTLPIANGGTNKTSVTTAPAASSWAGWDANLNLSANNLIDGFASTVTSGATTTLSVSSAGTQVFTGTNPQTITLPVASTLVNGQAFIIQNLSTASITVQTSGSNSLVVLSTNQTATITCVNTSGGTGTASWSYSVSTQTGASAGSGSKNYLTAYTASLSGGAANTGNGNFELGSTTGWSLGTTGTLTNGLPTGTPSFGSGSSVNLSLSLISAGQIAGSYSAGYVSSAATTAGNCLASNAFYIDKEDQAKKLTVSFSYQAATNPGNANWSGTSSNSYAVAIYDVTNSAWIQVNPAFGMIQSSVVGNFAGSFQTSAAGSQYRLVVYNANATSGAITLYLDDFFVGPQPIGFVSAISDWTQNNTGFAPSAGFGTVTSASYWTRRVGDTAEVTMSWVNGTVSGTTASISLPFTIDSTKLPSNASGTWVGQGTRDVTIATRGMWSNNDAYAVFYDGSTTNSVFVTTSTGSSTFTKAAGSGIGSNSDAVSVTFKVPVSGWSSGFAVTGSALAGNVIAASAYVSTNFAASTSTPINFDTKLFDTANSITTSASAWKFIAPASGYYNVEAAVAWASSTGDLVLYKNGSSTAVLATNTGSMVCNGSVVLQMNAGDFIDIRPGASLTAIGAAGPIKSFMSVYLLQSPSSVANSNATVAASYYCSTNQAGTTSVPFNFDTKEFDTTNSVTTGASWAFTAPQSGIYQVSLVGAFTSTAGVVQNLIYKNTGSGFAAYKTVGNANINSGSIPGSVLLSLNSGDQIQIRPTANETFTGGTLATAGTASINILKVG